MVLYLQCKKRGETYLRILRSGYINSLLPAFVQPIELLYDLRVFQFDDLAGEVVEGIFLGNVEKADADGAEGLGLAPVRSFILRLPYLMSPSTGLPR